MVYSESMADTDQTTACAISTGPSGPSCSDQPSRLVTIMGREVPLCGMHAMRYKPADGYPNRPIEDADV